MKRITGSTSIDTSLERTSSRDNRIGPGIGFQAFGAGSATIPFSLARFSMPPRKISAKAS